VCWHLLYELYSFSALNPYWSFVWNEIVHDISSDIGRWYHQYDAYSTPIWQSRAMLWYFPGSAGVACSPILSVSFKGMGCEPVLDLSATSDEAVSIICTFVDRTIISTIWGKLMYVSYNTDWPVVSVGHPLCALAINCLWILWHGWRTLMGCSVKMMLLLESSTCPMCILIPICRIQQFNSCMFMIIGDRYII
jgi:hypothetical protein